MCECDNKECKNCILYVFLIVTENKQGNLKPRGVLCLIFNPGLHNYIIYSSCNPNDIGTQRQAVHHIVDSTLVFSFISSGTLVNTYLFWCTCYAIH